MKELKKPNNHFKICSLIILLFFCTIGFSQSNINETENVNKLDPILYNGKLYSFSLSQNLKGSPFLFNYKLTNKQNSFVLGQITIRDKCYEDLVINYNIYNQKLLLKFDFLERGKKIIEISDVWLQDFCINNRYFIVTSTNNDEHKIYQTIGNSSLQFYYYWYNQLKMESNINSYYYYFTLPQKKMYLKNTNEIIRFTNNKTFYKLFNKDQAQKIKKYLKQNHLKVKKASDEQMLKLITFCNTL